MVMRIQRIGDEYGVVFSQEVLDALHLSDGAEVELRATEPIAGPKLQQPAQSSEHRYATVKEGLEAFRKTEPLHKNTLQELAK